MPKYNEEDLYYFTSLVGDKYYPLFVGWIKEDLIKAFEALEQGSSFAYIKVSIGEHTFISYVDKPLYLLNYENDDIFDHACDDTTIELYPSGNIPVEGVEESTFNFPRCFEMDVTPLIEYKLFDKFYRQESGLWIPIEL